MITIAIISQKGGAGKTTIGIHLAVAAEQLGVKTALFDHDPQASASSWSDKRNRPSPAVMSAQAARLPGLLTQAALAGKPVSAVLNVVCPLGKIGDEALNVLDDGGSGQQT